MDDPLSTFHVLRQIVPCLIICISGFSQVMLSRCTEKDSTKYCKGVLLMWINPVLPQLEHNNSPGDGNLSLSDVELGFISSG